MRHIRIFFLLGIVLLFLVGAMSLVGLFSLTSGEGDGAAFFGLYFGLVLPPVPSAGSSIRRAMAS